MVVGIGEKSIDCDQRRDSREDGQDGVVGHAGSERQDPMLRHVVEDPQQDVLPPASGISDERVDLAAANVHVNVKIIGAAARCIDGASVRIVICREVFSATATPSRTRSDAKVQPFEDACIRGSAHLRRPLFYEPSLLVFRPDNRLMRENVPAAATGGPAGAIASSSRMVGDGVTVGLGTLSGEKWKADRAGHGQKAESLPNVSRLL